LEETEQSGQPQNEKIVVAHHAHGRLQKDVVSAHHTQNEAITTPQSHTVEEMEEKRIQLPHTLNWATQKQGFLPYHAQSSGEEEIVREVVSLLSISKVEDSLRTTHTTLEGRSPRHHVPASAEHNHTQSHLHLGSRSYRINERYLPLNEQSKRESRLVLEGTGKQKKENNEVLSLNSIDTNERRVFWMGESSKNSKRRDRKHIRSVLSQISNSVSDMAINNCNCLFWQKRGSLETIRLWELGKQLGATCGDEGKIMLSLEELEKRDIILKSQREAGKKWVINENIIFKCERFGESGKVEIY